jgi:tRNA threonylcarbamoyladenosine biosynthesis protein TsaB
MALALGVPVVGVSSLDVVASGVRGGRGPLLVAMDARRGELFWAVYQRDRSGQVRRSGADRVDPPERVAEAAAELGTGVVVVGDGPARYPDSFAALVAGTGAVVLSGSEALPSPVTLVELGARALADGRGGPAATLAAVYVREPDALRWTPSPAPAADDAGAPPVVARSA